MFDDNKSLRIATYIRLKSNKREQRATYEKAVWFWKNYIGRHKNWSFIDVYADEGSNDYLTENMYEFKKMIDDCNKGKIDVIFAKSLSLFASNPAMAVSKIAQLAELSHPVGVFFEKEGCFSLDLDYKLALHILHIFLEEKKRKEEKSMLCSMILDLRMKGGIPID